MTSSVHSRRIGRVALDVLSSPQPEDRVRDNMAALCLLDVTPVFVRPHADEVTVQAVVTPLVENDNGVSRLKARNFVCAACNAHLGPFDILRCKWPWTTNHCASKATYLCLHGSQVGSRFYGRKFGLFSSRFSAFLLRAASASRSTRSISRWGASFTSSRIASMIAACASASNWVSAPTNV